MIKQSTSQRSSNQMIKSDFLSASGLKGLDSASDMPLEDQLRPLTTEPLANEPVFLYKEEKRSERWKLLRRCIYKTCLHPTLSLKNQLFLSFGVVSTLSLLFVMVTAIITSREAGDRVKSLARGNLERWSEDKLGVSVRMIAETVGRNIISLQGVASVMAETVKDRFVGYPDHPGYADDLLVPFRDMVSGRNIYPLTASSLIPLDWEFEVMDIIEENAPEHLQGRRNWYLADEISTATAIIRMQGACDPSTTDHKAKRFYPNCTDANNDLSVGGLVAPTTTMELIHKKASDIAGPILKPLFEASPSVKSLGYYLSNEGAGAVVAYPATASDSTTSYISAGCDWMRAPNPYNSSITIGTDEEIERCHPNGTRVANREYNPLDRDWCRHQALNPFTATSYGPYKDAFTHDLWLLTFGRAVYDRVTNAFVGCTLVDVAVNQVSKVLNDFSISDSSEIAFIVWDDEGTVVASEKWNSSYAKSTITIQELGMGVSKQLLTKMKEQFTSSYHSQLPYSPVFLGRDDGFALYPVPIPPAVYDKSYVPTFAIILSVDAAEIFATVNDLDDAVEEDVSTLIRTILIAGSIGIGAVILCIYLVSLYLTRPMEWMDEVGDHIVDSIGSHVTELKIEPSLWLLYTPRTEIKLLMIEFYKTVQRFSGQGTAKLHTHTGVEVKNPFVLLKNFEFLYEKRKLPTFQYNYKGSGDDSEDGNTTRFNTSLNRIHWGGNFHYLDGDTIQINPLHKKAELAEESKNLISSPLFWWILGTITIPLLLTMIVISVYVTWTISNKLPDLVVDVEAAHVSFEIASMYPLVKARAAFAASVIAPSLRDLHLLSRIAGWIFFGGLQKATTFSSITTGVEECKTASAEDPSSCPYWRNRSNTPCDCSWNQINLSLSSSCRVYEEDSRYLQQPFWHGSNQDAWPNGDVNFTSYPAVATSPATTSWWSEWNRVPGFELGFGAKNSNTAYETLLSFSALSMIQIPLFNYQADSLTDGTLATYLGFEDTGIFGGYAGCDYSHAFVAEFQSGKDNAAFQINSELCPLGKYGYDPRCRPWYLGGKLKHQEGKNPLYVSPPYTFASTGYVGQSASMPLREKGTYFGQVLLDFNVVPIIEALTQKRTPLNGDSFHVLVATTQHNFGTDTILAPGFNLQEDLGHGSKHGIEQSVLPFDSCTSDESDCDNLLVFREIYEMMRLGMSGSTSFRRTTATGGSEVVHWAYSPVQISSFSPLSNSNFSRGVEEYHSTIFSVALARTEPGLHDAFQSVEDELDKTVKTATIILSVLIFVAFLSVIFISARVTASIICPVSRLLQLVTSINKKKLNDVIPEIQGGSCEVMKVHGTFQRLYLVVRYANTALFAGDLDTAYKTLLSDLALFTKLRNDKAIGVANNNLGNTMLAIFRTMKTTGASFICGLSLTEVIEYGSIYFKNTIDRGEEALARINKEEGWSTNYLVFMQQLSNRYFNRAIFLLTTNNYHPIPHIAEMQGLTDLATSKDMDREVVDNGDHDGFKGDRDVYFELLLGRIKGILQLEGMGYDDEREIEELVEDARKELVGALREPDHIMFRNIKPAGQMQRLDATLIEHCLSKCQYEKAAVVAIRMLVEDDYVIGEAAVWAIKALNDYVPKLRADTLGGDDPSDVQSLLFQCRQRITQTMSSKSQWEHGKCGKKMMMRESAKQSTFGDVSMEMF